MGMQERNGGQVPAWTKAQLDRFEQRLLDERKTAVEQMAQFDETMGKSQEAQDGELTSWRFHMADEGTDTYEREQTFLLASREGELLWQIDQALRRLYKAPETYGRCDDCGRQIAEERLDAIPYVATCVDCKAHSEDRPGG